MSSDEPSKPSGRRWRGIAVAAGIAIVLVVVTLASALLFREDLAEAALRDQFIELGFKDPRFRVEHFTTGSIAITAFSAGTGVSFDRLAVGFSASDILRGRVARIDLTGLQLDMTRPGPWTGLQSKSDGGAGSSLDPSVLPIINIGQARVRIAGPAGPMMVTATAHLLPDPDGNLAFQATASTIGPPGQIDMGFEGTIRVRADGGATAAGRLSATSNSLTVGKATFKSLKIELPLTVDAATAGAAVIVSNGARFETDRLDLDTGFGTGSISVSFTGRLTSTSSSGGWFDGNADIAVDSRNIRAGDLAAQRFTGALAMQVKAGPGTATLNMARDGRLALDGFRTARNSPVTRLSTLLSGKVAVSWPVESAGAGFSIDHELSIVPAPVTLPGSPDIHAVPGKIETSGLLAANGAYQGHVAMESGRLTRGNQSVAIAGLSARLTTKAGLAQPGARITVKGLRDMSAATIAGKPVGGTYDLAATVQQTGSRLAYQADIGGLGLKKLIAIAGTHDLATRAGHADVSLPTIPLGPAGVPPASVIPALNTIRKVTGSIGGDARLTWNGQGFDGRARLRLDGIGGETDDGVVEGLGGAIVFNTLMPPSTAPGQLLRIRNIAAGAVLTDTSIRFALLPSGILRVARAEAMLAGGKIIIVAPAIDPVAQEAKATVTLQGVQLAQLLKLADLGDLQASGQIHGFVPIRIADGKIAIDAGALASLGGGTLRFKSERAKQVLKSGGDQVALMLQALEDFSYEQLGIDIDKTMAGNARVMLRTLGRNPAVLQGRKFQINVSLETNLDRVLDAALEWYRLSGRALRSIFTPETRKGIR